MRCKKGLELKVLHSMAGFYIGTADEDGPFCRLSEDYYKSREKAEGILKAGIFKDRDAAEIRFCNGGDCGLSKRGVEQNGA
jgi:hypothetical protein